MSNSSMRVRVMHLVPALFDISDGILGGAERYAYELAKNMSKHVPTTLVTFGRVSREEYDDGLRIRVLGNPWRVRGQETNPFALGIIKEIRKASIVHCHQQHVLAGSAAALLCRITSRRVFVSDLGGGGWDVSSYVSTDRWFHGHLHLSEYSRRISGHADKPWAHVIRGGVDTDRFTPNPAAERNGTVLFVGRILPHKGIDDLIRAVGPETPVEIVGQQIDAKYLNDLRSLAGGKKIVFHGAVPDEELIEKYRKASCVVLPSVYKTMYGEESAVPELLGQTLLESMACGTPVICTRVGAMPEVVEDGVTGFVIPPNDPEALKVKLDWMKKNPDLAMEIGTAGRKHVLSNFQWEAVVQRCLGIYSGVNNAMAPDHM